MINQDPLRLYVHAHVLQYRWPKYIQFLGPILLWVDCSVVRPIHLGTFDLRSSGRGTLETDVFCRRRSVRLLSEQLFPLSVHPRTDHGWSQDVNKKTLTRLNQFLPLGLS